MALLFERESYALVGAAIEMRKELGLGFLEPVYQEAYGYVLQDKKIPYRREVPLAIRFRNRILEKKYFADFLCYGKIIIEFKAVRQILPEHEAQLMNYLRCTGFHLGLLFNFGPTAFTHRRIISGINVNAIAPEADLNHGQTD